MKDDLGKRMKEQYEQRTRTFLPRRTYTIIRLDGKAFHTFTRNMKRPYDEDFMTAMDNTARFLCKEIQGCKLAYVQSDEISLLLTDFDKITTDAWFDGQVQKMVSVAASMATAMFNKEMLIINMAKTRNVAAVDNTELFPADMESVVIRNPLAFFDARIFTIPDPVEVENYFVWRQKDAVRNSLSMTAQSVFSHAKLHAKSQSDMHDMLHNEGVNWNDLPEGFKRGRTITPKALRLSTEGMSYAFADGNWHITAPDFLKQRELLTGLIPKINYE